MRAGLGPVGKTVGKDAGAGLGNCGDLAALYASPAGLSPVRSGIEICARRAGDVHFPEIDWASADVELVTPVQKKPISIRLDSDVLEFFQQDGKGYQGRINQVLRSFMEYEKKTG